MNRLNMHKCLVNSFLLCARDKVELTKELQQEEAVVKEKMAKWQQAHYQLIQSILDECELK